MVSMPVLYFFLAVVLGGDICGIYKSSYNVSSISYLNSHPQPLSYILSSPILGIILTDNIFAAIHVYTVFAPYSHS
jgi:hypothetical protein